MADSPGSAPSLVTGLKQALADSCSEMRVAVFNRYALRISATISRTEIRHFVTSGLADREIAQAIYRRRSTIRQIGRALAGWWWQGRR